VKHQSVQLLFHLFYLVVTIIYITDVYQYADIERLPVLRILLLLSLLNPCFYELVQFKNLGPIEYFTNGKQWIDFLFVTAGLANLILTFIPAYADEDLPLHLATQFLMILTVLCAIPKTFLFLRNFGSLSYIVTMLFNVINDLKIFLLFYTILIFLFSQFLTILGMGSCKFDYQTVEGYENYNTF